MGKKKNRSVNREQVYIGGTPETVKKLTPGTIEILLRNQRIGREHVSAAQEIETVYKAVTGGLYTGNVMKERVDGKGKMGSLTEFVAMLYRDHYTPWANDLDARRAAGGPPIRSIVIDVVVNGKSAKDLDKDWRWRKGRSCNYLIEGLELYAIEAGWLRKKGY